jgi:hypothetical protein
VAVTKTLTTTLVDVDESVIVLGQAPELPVGTVPSVVQWYAAPGVLSLMVRVCEVLNAPPLGETVGAAAWVSTGLEPPLLPLPPQLVSNIEAPRSNAMPMLR